MAITYTLTPTQLTVSPQAEGQTDVVIEVGWAYTGTDGTRSGAFGGTTAVTYTQGNPFTPYADLTQEQVAGWVTSSWTPEQTTAYQTAISDQIAVQTPPLPWAASQSASAPADPVA